MRRTTLLLLAIILVTLFISSACKRGADSPDLTNLGPSSAATTTILPIGSSLCPGGGIGIYSGRDTNNNGVLEAGEIQKGNPICNPPGDAKRPAGLVTLVMIASEPAGTQCAAGGLKVLSGPDANKNGMLDPNEIAFTDYLCNGTPGASSAAGIAIAVGPVAASASSSDKNKGKKPVLSKKPNAAAMQPWPGAAGRSRC